MPMRGLRTTWAAAGALVLAPALALGQNAQVAQIKKILEFRPVVQGAAVDFDTPADAAAIAGCKYEITTAPVAYILRDGTGKVLRRFVDNDGDRKLDQWSYYQDGFEVYRELDGDRNGKLDEARWLNAGGTRVAVVAGNKVQGWRRISAEEASKVLVQAILADDLALLETVMARPEDLAALGVPAAEVGRVEEAAKGRAEAFAALRKGLVGWDRRAAWLRLDAAMPHAIPADAGVGLKGDLTLYENAVIWAAPSGGGTNDTMSFLQSTELVEVGDAWKFVDLPRAINPSSKEPVVAAEGGIRAAVYRDAAGGSGGSPAQEKAIQELAAFDNANADKLNADDKKEVARYYIGRVRFLRDVEKACKKPDEALVYQKQEIDCVANAYQTGQYPEGLKALKALEESKEKSGSYAAFRRLNADFNLENDNPGVNVVAVQKKWMNDMKEFLAAYPKADEVPEVLFQLASNNEFNADEAEAREYYGRLVASYPDTTSGKKAAGALRRLDSVGKSIALKGKTLDGREVDTSRLAGKTLLIAFWATSVQAARQDMPEIAKIHAKDKAKGFEVVGVCLDSDPKSLAEFLKATPLPWPTVFEPGGLESRLAVEFGVIALPTMILVDAEGKVVNRSVRNAADLDIQLDKLLAGKGGVALGKP